MDELKFAWKIAQDDQVAKVFVAPGNAGTATEDKCENVALNILDNPAIINFAKNNAVDLIIVGPEAPLVNGVVDACREAGVKVWGPTQFAAQLEGSKAFAKHFLKRHNIPTAFYDVFTEVNAAKAFVEKNGAPIVIKADGLAAGKGVIVAMTNQEAFDAIDDMLAGNKFGNAGSRVVIEEFLAGEEASFICMIDGDNILPMATSQDHKRIFEGDQGPNTGSWARVKYAMAGSVVDALFALKKIKRDHQDIRYWKIAPIGTKPHTIAALLFAILNPRDTEIVYDNPNRKKARTKGVGNISVTCISDLITEYRHA